MSHQSSSPEFLRHLGARNWPSSPVGAIAPGVQRSRAATRPEIIWKSLERELELWMIIQQKIFKMDLNWYVMNDYI